MKYNFHDLFMAIFEAYIRIMFVSIYSKSLFQ